MVTTKGENVVICARCKRLWKKSKAEEEKVKGARMKGETNVKSQSLPSADSDEGAAVP